MGLTRAACTGDARSAKSDDARGERGLPKATAAQSHVAQVADQKGRHRRHRRMSRSGAWLSPVERCVRVAEVPGSNPGAPIIGRECGLFDIRPGENKRFDPMEHTRRCRAAARAADRRGH